MPDDKRGRDEQARNVDNRQRERAAREELDRWEETDPEVDREAIADVEADLGAVDYPATSADVVEAVGDREVESTDGTYTVAELLPDTDTVAFDDARAVRVRVERPTVAASLKRIVEAVPNRERNRLGSQLDAYEKTLLALKDVTADDDDEGIEVVTDWVVDRIGDGKHPSSRNVRRRGAKFVRENGYEVRNDEWLGV